MTTDPAAGARTGGGGVSALTVEQRKAFRDGGQVPAGWRWCPDCNGEGVITTMAADPDLTEHTRPCTRCETECGIVPDPEAK